MWPESQEGNLGPLASQRMINGIRPCPGRVPKLMGIRDSD
jgi:hypothetical protein